MKTIHRIAIICLLLTLFTGCAQNQAQPPQTIEITKLVEATRIVEVTRQVEVTNNVEVTRVVMVTPTKPIPTITPTLANIQALDPRASIFVDGNASPKLEQGEPGKLSIISTGEFNGHSITVIIRNNTPNDYIRIEVTGSAYSPDGKLIATGGSQEFNPNLVRPGEISMGYVYFGSDITLPENTKIEYEVAGTNLGTESSTYENIRDLMIKENNLIDKRVVGFLENAYDVQITGPIEVVVFCFNENDQLIGYSSDFTDKDTVDPRGTAPFQVEIYSKQCPKYLVSSYGFADYKSPLYPDYSVIPTKSLQPSESQTVIAEPIKTQEATQVPPIVITPTRTLNSSEVDAVRQTILKITSENLAKLEDVENVNLVRFPDDNTLEIELKLRWASKDRQPIASYNVINMLAGGFLTEAGKGLLDKSNLTNLTIKITTYSTDGGFRYKSETGYETLQQIYDKSISYEEWIMEANAGFR